MCKNHGKHKVSLKIQSQSVQRSFKKTFSNLQLTMAIFIPLPALPVFPPMSLKRKQTSVKGALSYEAAQDPPCSVRLPPARVPTLSTVTYVPSQGGTGLTQLPWKTPPHSLHTHSSPSFYRLSPSGNLGTAFNLIIWTNGQGEECLTFVLAQALYNHFFTEPLAPTSVFIFLIYKYEVEEIQRWGGSNPRLGSTPVWPLPLGVWMEILLDSWRCFHLTTKYNPVYLPK